MECYICHTSVERDKYTPHIASHLAGGATGIAPLPGPVFPALSYDTGGYNYHDAMRPAHSAPPRLSRTRTLPEDAHRLHPVTPNNQLQSSHSPVRFAAVPDRGSQQEMSGAPGQPTPNDFQMWLDNYAYSSPKYTTIDGEKSDSDLEVFRQDAQVLRGTTREEVIKIVKAFEGFPCSEDRKTCLGLVKRVPIFPVG